MKYDVANRRIWYKGEILNVNDAKINILAPLLSSDLRYLKVFRVIGMKKKNSYMLLD